MKTIFTRLMAAAFALSLASGTAIAQEVEKITVQATRMITTKTVGRTPSGVPIVDVSLSYGVSVAGLDLGSSKGAAELEKRIHDAARAACREIGRQYPDASPGDTECARVAADKAMVKARELIAAAQKTPGK